MSDVTDNQVAGRYELATNGLVSFAEYRVADGVATLPHTVVPPELRGRGVAGRLIAGALDDLRARGLKVAPACSFVARHMARHPETHDLLAPGWKDRLRG